MKPEELERILDQHRQKSSADRWLYFVALLCVGVVLILVYGAP